MTSVEGYYLVAHAINVVSYDRVEVEWEVASQGIDGEWYDNNGRHLIPFRTIPIEQPTPSIPMGWVEHIQDLACKAMAPTPNLLDRLGLAKPQPSNSPFLRRL
jgi:hypothetical protein